MSAGDSGEFVRLCCDSLGDAGTIFCFSDHEHILRALCECENRGRLQARDFSTID